MTCPLEQTLVGGVKWTVCGVCVPYEHNLNKKKKSYLFDTLCNDVIVNYFRSLQTDGMTFQCFCLEHFKNLSVFNTTECRMSCTQERDDLCSGEDGRLIVYEIGNNTEISAAFFFICSRITELF